MEKERGLFGRPPLFKTVKEFTDRADEYFKEKDGSKISWTGLCLAVGAASRQSLDRYRRGEHGTDFVGAIKRALMVVENYYEETAEGAKSIFILKNFEWRDNIDINAKVEDVKMTEAQLDEEIKKYQAKLEGNSKNE